MKPHPFQADHPVYQALLRWHEELHEKHRGDRAELRRANSPLEVELTAAFHRARKRLQKAAGEVPLHDERLALVIGLSSHLKERMGSARNVAEACRSGEGERPRITPLRFRQLLEAQTPEEFYPRLRRVLPIVKQGGTGGLGLRALSADLYAWGHSAGRERVKRQWIYDYPWPSK